MGQIQLTDEFLYQCMPIIDEAMIKALEAQVDDTYQFSEKFEKKMKRVIWKESHMWLKDFYRFVRRAAVFVICIIAALFILTMSVDAYRDKFFQTVKEIWEDSIMYRYFTDENKSGVGAKEPSYIPEGYQEVERVVSNDLLSIVYENESGDQIFWDCMLIIDEDYNILDSEYDDETVVKVNGENLVISLYSEGYVTAYYEYNEYVFILNASNLDKEEICNMFISIAEYE